MAQNEFTNELHTNLKKSFSNLRKIYETEIEVKEVTQEVKKTHKITTEKVKHVKTILRKMNEINVKTILGEELMGFGNDFICLRIGGENNVKLREAFTELYSESKLVMDTLERLFEMHEQCVTTEPIAGVHKSFTTPQGTPRDKPPPHAKPAQSTTTPKTDKESPLKPQEKSAIANLEEKVNSLNEQMEKLQKENETLSKNIGATNTQMKRLQQENDVLKQVTDNGTKAALVLEITNNIQPKMTERQLVQQLMDKNSEMIDRLAGEMNAKISSNESALENISIKNRPMNVVDDFNILMANTWLEAKEELDKKHAAAHKEDSKVTLLCDILMASQDQAVKLHDSKMDELFQYLHNLFTSATKPAQPAQGGKTHVSKPKRPEALVNSIGDYLRVYATPEQMGLHALVTVVEQDIKQKNKEVMKLNKDQLTLLGKHLHLPNVEAFMVQCLGLSWKMAIQRPRMYFKMPYKCNNDNKSIWRDQPELDLMFDSKPKQKGAMIRYYKQPCLYHGEQLMAKGIVLVH